MSFDNPYVSYNTQVAIVAASGASLQTLIPAQSGYACRVLGIQATNMSSEVVGVSFYNGAEKMLPTTFIGASGTYLNNDIVGGQQNLTPSSGLNVAVTTGSGVVEVSASYLCRDERDPLTKEQYRAASYVAPGIYNATRTPNQFGGQSKS